MTDLLAERLLSGFQRAFGADPLHVVRAPGRVNLIGEHTDYNDGFALPAALGVETRVASRPRADGRVEVVALDFDDARDAFALGEPVTPAGGGDWRDYVRAIFSVHAARGLSPAGMDIAIAGNIPRGTGLSSSASLEVALARTLAMSAGREWDPVAGALLAQAAENDFVGVRCGNLDQLASAGAVAGAALLIDCRSLALQPVPLPDDIAIMIVQSGVERGLVDGHYNRRREACEIAAQALGVAALRDADLAMLDRHRGAMVDEVYRCARHVVADNARTLNAAEALAKGDLATMGELMRASHASMRDDFRITVPHTDTLAALLSDLIGSEGGARQTGGGFGGAVVALLPLDAAIEVADAVRERYRTPSGAAPLVMVERPRAGASRV